ncbi:hypothetical protein QAD02_007144 [Eretmocerus hayati]|uniref:Uncharacterized protein n=1 Tax=Eretmocerus hayati TaxID=131215 RepID=A0ACC2N365_9HYME|nr:hypothetical protein QAD02_007144 [Eretmocerus hayati]
MNTIQICLSEVYNVIEFHAVWSSQDNKEFRGLVSLDTTLEPFVGLEMSTLFRDNSRDDMSFYGELNLTHHHIEHHRLQGRLIDGEIDGSMELHGVPGLFKLAGEVTKVDECTYRVNAAFENRLEEKTFGVIASLRTSNGSISILDLYVYLRSKKTATLFDGKLAIDEEQVNLDALDLRGSPNLKMKAALNDSYNWNLRTNIEAGESIEWTFATSVSQRVEGDTTLFLEIITPLEGIKAVLLDGKMLLNRDVGYMNVVYQMDRVVDRIETNWHMIYLSDMLFRLNILRTRDSMSARNIRTSFFYNNLKESLENVLVGFNVNVDRDKWDFGSNLTLQLKNLNDVDATIKVRLPAPYNDEHLLTLGYQSLESRRDITYKIGYSTIITRLNYSSGGLVSVRNF